MSEISKYQNWYNQLIERARSRSQLLCYFEIHHIIPRSLGGGDDPGNLVALTYREHFLAHWLLAKIHNEGKGRRAMAYALLCMGTMGNGQRLISSWQFEIAKRQVSDLYVAGRQASILKILEESRKSRFKFGQRLIDEIVSAITSESNLHEVASALLKVKRGRSKPRNRKFRAKVKLVAEKPATELTWHDKELLKRCSILAKGWN